MDSSVNRTTAIRSSTVTNISKLETMCKYKGNINN